jgi:hypothetical protein
MLALIAILWAPAPAGAAQTTPTTFGANLAAQTPQSSTTCASLYYQATCTLSTSADSLGGIGESFVVPQGSDDHGTGAITAFHIKVGASTGPMQILLMQALRQQQSGTASCCSVVDATGVFTPAADAITTVPVRWTTENDNVPNPYNGVYAFDTMAISVGSGVALPVAPFSGAVDTFWAPACPGTVGTECDVYGGDERYVVTMSADWTPNGGGGPGPGPNPRPVLSLKRAFVPVRNEIAAIPLSCATALCIGKLQLQNFADGKATAASKHRKPVTYGSASFSIAAGKAVTIKIKLNAAGKRLLKAHKTAKVYANAAIRNGGTVSRQVTLSR